MAYQRWIEDDQPRDLALRTPIVYLLVSCERYLHKALPLYQRLAPGLNPAFIVLGDAAADEAAFDGKFLKVPAPDNYESLTPKVLEAFTAVRRRFGLTGIVKIDDDTRVVSPPDYARIDKLISSTQYAGYATVGDPTFDRCWHLGKCENLRDETYRKKFRGNWAGGPLYYLGPKAADHVVRDYLFYPAEFDSEIYEDKVIGDTLKAHGIAPSTEDLLGIFGIHSPWEDEPPKLDPIEYVWDGAGTRKNRDLGAERSAFWEAFFCRGEDPWHYENAYETAKYQQTLELLPAGPIGRALELACAEGHFTKQLAPRVSHLVASDIAPTAVNRTRHRCAALPNIEYRLIDFIRDELPRDLDLIVCSEALYYTPLVRLPAVAAKLTNSLAIGGHLLMAHPHLVADEPERTGFDWGPASEFGGPGFGVGTIAQSFAGIPELSLIRELRTELYRIQLFRKIGGDGLAPGTPDIVEVPLPPELPLEVARSVVWGGSVITRHRACAIEFATDLPILMYHSIAEDGPRELDPYRVSLAAFRDQLRWLRRHGYYSITLGEWASCIAEQRRPRGRPIVISFDDGYRNFLTNAWPALQAADFRATMFVVTGKVGTAADWDATSAAPLELMDWDELRVLRDQGLEIGSHSTQHTDLLSLSDEEIVADSVQARAALRQELGTDVSAVAFPWGKNDARIRGALARGGFRIAVATDGGRSRFGDNPMRLPRIEIFGSDDIDMFASRVESDAGIQRRDHAEQTRQPADPDMGLKAILDWSPSDQEELLMNPDYARRLAARLGRLIDGLMAIRTELLTVVALPESAQKKLLGLFTMPVTEKDAMPIEPYHEVCNGVQVGFESTASVKLTVAPKPDHSVSPENCLNTLNISYAGPGSWLTIEAGLEWSELASAERYQLALYGEPDRYMTGRADLRLPLKDGGFADATFSTFDIEPGLKGTNKSGELKLPDIAGLDTSRKPLLLLFFDTKAKLAITLNYVNLYFS